MSSVIRPSSRSGSCEFQAPSQRWAKSSTHARSTACADAVCWAIGAPSGWLPRHSLTRAAATGKLLSDRMGVLSVALAPEPAQGALELVDPAHQELARARSCLRLQ